MVQRDLDTLRRIGELLEQLGPVDYETIPQHVRKFLTYPKTMYLVVVRHALDDLPVLLTADRTAAMAAAETATPNSGDPAADVLGIDVSTPGHVALYTFEDGVLTDASEVKDFDDEAEAGIYDPFQDAADEEAATRDFLDRQREAKHFLARLFGVNQSTISRIHKQERWAKV